MVNDNSNLNKSGFLDSLVDDSFPPSKVRMKKLVVDWSLVNFESEVKPLPLPAPTVDVSSDAH